MVVNSTKSKPKGRRDAESHNGRPAADTLDRPPPHNLDAEKGVLGSVLLLPDVLDEVRPILRADDFYDEANQRLLWHMLALHDAGRPVDVTLLIERLKSAGEYERVGGAAYLHEVGNSVPHASSARYYAEIVKDKATKRALIRAGTDLLREAYDDSAPSAELLERANHAVDAIVAAQSVDNSAVVESFAVMAAEELIWLWRHVLLLGAINVIFGDPGDGKSLTAADFCARLSAGLGWPDAPNEFSDVGSALILTTEDKVAATVRSRLIAAGANLENVHAFRGIPDGPRRSRPRQAQLPRDLPAIESAIKNLRHPRLLVLDPLDSFLPSIDHHNDVEVRLALTPLAEIAEALKVAVLILTHGRKGYGKAVHGALGSVGIIAAARLAWQLKRDPKNSRRRLLLPVKSNVSDDGRGWAFEIRVGSDSMPVLAWETEPIKMRADDMDDRTSTMERKSESRRQAKAHDDAEARERLLSVLRDLYPAGETKSQLTSLARLGRDRGPRLLRELEKEERIEPCPVHKPDRKTPRSGYRLRKGTDSD
jgi:hypothetical protein